MMIHHPRLKEAALRLNATQHHDPFVRSPHDFGSHRPSSLGTDTTHPTTFCSLTYVRRDLGSGE